MKVGRIFLKIGAVPLVMIVAILNAVLFVLSKAAGWVFGPIILFVIGCMVFCVFKQEWTQFLPLVIILAGAFGLLFGAGILTEVVAMTRKMLVRFLIS